MKIDAGITDLPESHKFRRYVAHMTIDYKCRGDWLHVDFEDNLRLFYFDACGFIPTNAGLIAL